LTIHRWITTGIWHDPFVQKLIEEDKLYHILLFIYLITNSHCNQAGFYQITERTIASESGLRQREIPDVLRELHPKVVWWEEFNLVWITNFLKWQCSSYKYLISAKKAVDKISVPSTVTEQFYDRYKDMFADMQEKQKAASTYGGRIRKEE